ncbi:MAG: formylmethanofuran dehydrogenase [Firmicutes bacterium]|nr:formylmethanofuran dehydrogenase [Bacillota bacterium]
MRSFEEDLQSAIAYHGHVCSGVVLGVRMARLGLKKLGIEEPHCYRDLIVYLEVDRCLSDAVQTVSGCTLGKRRLKLLDYGKLAATFVDISTNKAVRLAVVAEDLPQEGEDPVAFWQGVADEDIFKVENVLLEIRPEDLPGKPLRRVVCSSCGEAVLDGRELIKNGETLCFSCANTPYYRMMPK